MMNKIVIIGILSLLGSGISSRIDSSSNNAHKLTVYWGQDSAGSLRLKLETKILDFCQNYEYDIIPIAFLNVFFDTANKDNFPGINLANHCNKTFKSYPTLLNCTDIGYQINKCQKMGKKVLLSLGGAAGLYYFSSSTQATTFAERIWELFLDGSSNVRPFHTAILDGVDLDIEGGTTTYYADFVKALRSLMYSDKSKKYYITGAPQCPYPDAIMGPGRATMVLQEVPQEFDYLYVQFYNNYCSLGHEKEFNTSIYSWFNFAEHTRLTYGKGPLICIGMPSSPRVNGYQAPSVVEAAYNSVRDNRNFGGVMLWDASFDENNMINGQHYSSIIKSFMNTGALMQTHKRSSYIFEVVVCKFPSGRKVTITSTILAGFTCLVVAFVALAIFVVRIRRRQEMTPTQGTDMSVDNAKDVKYVPLKFV